MKSRKNEEEIIVTGELADALTVDRTQGLKEADYADSSEAGTLLPPRTADDVPVVIVDPNAMRNRVSVTRTLKLFMGDWRRPESGRTTQVGTAAVPVASRKDSRDAVRVARGAQAKWASSTPYLRGQIIYRLAEMLEARTESFASDLLQVAEARGQSLQRQEALHAVAHMVDRVVSYAGWPDKLGVALGSVNSVSQPFLSTTGPTPSGVVVTFPPARTVIEAVMSIADSLCAPLACGNSVIICLPPESFMALVSLQEALATCDLPQGTVSVLCYANAEPPRTLAAHSDVDGIDLEGLDLPGVIVEDATGIEVADDCMELASQALTRVRHSRSRTRALDRLSWAQEARTVWMPQAL